VLGAPDTGGGPDVHVDEADVSHPFEVGAHRVRVQAQCRGDIAGGQRPGRAGKLEVDGVARVVAERLEHVETVGIWAGHADNLQGNRR
jgi:hypothetical protein